MRLRAGRVTNDETMQEINTLLIALDKTWDIDYAVKPGDGSAREQAASCQRVIGGLANIAEEYATKRYRSNVINWGMLPLQMAEVPTFEVGDYIYIPGIKAALDNPGTTFKGYVIHEDAPVTEITLYMESLTAEEREIIKAGSLINFNKNRQM